MTLCAGCTGKLETDLREVRSMVEALWASAARLDVGTGSVGSSGHSAPMEPTNSRAYDAGRTLNVILTGWTNILGDRQPHAVKAAALLLVRIRDVRAEVWAPDLAQELHDSLADCRAAMDRTAPKVFAGICPGPEDMPDCNSPVYTPEGKTDARCKTCGTVWDATDWRERAITAAGYATGTAAEISRILSDPVRNLALPQGTIRVWANRDKLTAVGTSTTGQPTYLIADVRAVWEARLEVLAERRNRMENAA